MLQADSPVTQKPVTLIELVGLTLGTLICGLPTLVYGATYPSFVPTTLALMVAAAGMAFLDPGVRWQIAGGVGFGLLLMNIVRVVVDFQHDPTSHNLAGFEVVISLAIGFPPAVLGLVLGKVLRPKLPRPELVGVMLMALAVGGTVMSARGIAADLLNAEAMAVRKTASLLAAERTFRAAHPLRGYTCDLGELSVPFGGAIKKNHPSATYRLGGVVYRGGTGVREGEYLYSLKCEARPDPQESFVLTVWDSNQVGSRPLHFFCAGPDGVVRAIGRGKLDRCFPEGQIVEKLD